MSRLFTPRFASLTPYTPGEQPKDMQYIKLNTNESPFPPSAGVIEAAQTEAGRLQLYSDPECKELRTAAAAVLGVKPEQLVMTNGSDDVLNFAFMAFADKEHPLVFPDITYGFYRVFADFNGIPYRQVPLKEDFTVDYRDYLEGGETVVIANPNAPTGMALGLAEIEKIVAADKNRVVIVDEAYVDFGGESAVKLIDQYDNLLVTQTFSKSRSLAGARLGFGIGNEGLIADLNTLRYSTNPYNVNRMTGAAGIAALKDNAYYMENCRQIAAIREATAKALQDLGFAVLPSQTNFLFATTPVISGAELYRELKQRGILIRHFDAPRIKNYIRVTIGTADQMQCFLGIAEDILTEKKKDFNNLKEAEKS